MIRFIRFANEIPKYMHVCAYTQSRAYTHTQLCHAHVYAQSKRQCLVKLLGGTEQTRSRQDLQKPVPKSLHESSDVPTGTRGS